MSNERYTRNEIATVSPEFRGMVYSGNYLDLSSTQELPIPLPNSGGANDYLTYWDATLKEFVQIANQDDADSSRELVENGDFSDGSDNWTDILSGVTITDEFNTDGTSNSNLVKQQISAKKDRWYQRKYTTKNHISGSLGLNWIGSGGAITSSANEDRVVIDKSPLDASGEISIYTNNNGVCSIDNISIKEVLPISTTYTFKDQAVGEICTQSVPFISADIDLLNAQPELLGRLALGATDTGLSLSTSDIVSWYNVGEDGAAIIDAKNYTLGVERADTFTGTVHGDETYIDHVTTINEWHCEITVAGTSSYNTRCEIRSTLGRPKNGLFLTKFLIEKISGEVAITQSRTGNFAYVYNELIDSKYKNISYLAITDDISSDFQPIIYMDGTKVGEFRITGFSTKEVTSTYAEITNYDSTVRKTQQQYGSQSLAFKLNEVGVPAAIADANSINVENNDGYVKTGFFPNLDTYTIEENVEGNLEVLDAAGAATGSQTERTEQRILTVFDDGL